MADDDVSDRAARLGRARTGTLNALREDPADLREEMRQGFASVNASLCRIIELLARDSQ
ncbi:hypothetical protein [Amycolatopsis dendrobii]|uniref:Uncharacterized protein n=1 Tax=Amycolatopsis dendrobii TaxID=2760662 RepID=A0A7W3Z7W8_9PSEU|nr:hypothetical protein [Amycolatopsis dendrobii]MBB1151590.1 hypothetical protein [Amycolatopsis dendrobii]